MKLLLLSITVFFLHCGFSAAKSNPFELETGLWEGISDQSGHNYYLLQVNKEEGKHELFIANVASAFQYIKKLPFSNSDISCRSFECTISINNPYDANVNIQMIIVPDSPDSLKILEISVDNEGLPIISRSYQLDKNNGKSTVREFIEHYRERIDSLNQNSNNDLYGFWIGVSEIRDKKQLVVMDVKDNEKSEFVLMINGNATTNDTYFYKNDISVFEGKTKIRTHHKTFANQIILHHMTKNMLYGHMYSYNNGVALESAAFKLFRVQKRVN